MLRVKQGLQKLPKFDKNDLILLFPCYILISRKCPRQTPFKTQWGGLSIGQADSWASLAQASRDFICIFQQLLLNYSGLEFSLQSEISLCSVTRGIAMDISGFVGILGPKKIPLFVGIRKNQNV